MKNAGAAAENWKYTNLAPLEAVDWAAPVRSESLPPLSPAPYPVCGRIVFHNGFLLKEACFLPDGVCFAQDNPENTHRPEGAQNGDTRIFDMNAAHLQDSVALCVTAGVNHSDPLDILFLAESESPVRLSPRLSIACESESALRLVERHAGAGPSLSALCIFIEIDGRASLEHIRLGNGANAAHILEMTKINISQGGSYAGFYYTDGGRLSRHQVAVTLSGPRAQTRIDAVTLLRGDQHSDLTTAIRHATPGAHSSQVVRSVLEGRARGVYQGKITVSPGADGTDARQQSRALLLSEGAEMDTKPELEILADDVKCSHGAATGTLDPEALFYLRARGVPEWQARMVLVEGFVSERLGGISCDAVREDIAARIAGWLKKTGDLE